MPKSAKNKAKLIQSNFLYKILEGIGFVYKCNRQWIGIVVFGILLI